jgi:hypothetical protein
MRDRWTGLDLFTEVRDALHGHGCARGDDHHADHAIFLIGDLTCIYEGARDHPVGPSIHQPPTPPPSEPPDPDSRDAVIVPASELKTVLIALDIAADYKRDRAEMCTGYPDQSCPACQARLHDAQAYGQMADHTFRVAEAAPAAHHGQAEPARPPARHSRLTSGKEAGQ